MLLWPINHFIASYHWYWIMATATRYSTSNSALFLIYNRSSLAPFFSVLTLCQITQWVGGVNHVSLVILFRLLLDTAVADLLHVLVFDRMDIHNWVYYNSFLVFLFAMVQHARISGNKAGNKASWPDGFAIFNFSRLFIPDLAYATIKDPLK